MVLRGGNARLGTSIWMAPCCLSPYTRARRQTTSSTLALVFFTQSRVKDRVWEFGADEEDDRRSPDIKNDSSRTDQQPTSHCHACVWTFDMTID